MKLIEPRKPIILRSTGFLSGKTTVGDRFGKVSGDSGGVVEAQHAFKTICRELERSSLVSIQLRLFEYGARMMRYLSRPNAGLEVGPVDSTPSLGKPRTWGSDGTRNALFKETSSALRGGS